ncbi:MAG TPA: hypothetical protein VFR08_07745, partial [Candidatus Angelobacter sp.]|nr:hypothetical protein [Candidatus Angelobacter sp.]
MSSDCDNCTTLSDADVASKETTDGALKVPGIQENRECGEEQVCGRLAIPIESQISRLLLRKLEEQCESYCILTGYDGLPDRFDTDIDFMVSTRDFSRIPALIDEIAAETGTRVFQMIPHEISGRAFRLAAESKGELAFIQPDSCSDYRHFGKLWLCADEVLATRRPHPSGFWIPGAACEFIYYLIKRVNKRDFTNVHGTKLSRLYQEDPQKSKSYLRRFWKERSAGALADMAAKNDWPSLIANMNEFRRELRRRSNLGAGLFRRALHALERVEQPTGGWVAFVGPDGCGKSTVIDAVAAEFGPAFQRVVRCHLRPKSLPARSSGEFPVTDPHGQPVRGRLYSMLKMLYLFSDYWLGYVTFVKRQTVRTKLVIFDRYFYDILID